MRHTLAASGTSRFTAYILVVLIVASSAFACRSLTGATNNNADNSNAPIDATPAEGTTALAEQHTALPPDFQSRAALQTTADTSAEARELAALVETLINESEFKHARWGVFVQSLRDGRVLYRRNETQLFVPASNMKAYTTAVALDLLGADFRWRTSVYASAAPNANGDVAGDLVLYGRGAPDLRAQSGKADAGTLERLAAELARRGVRRVRGKLVGDESYLRGEVLGDGWLWNDIAWYYGAEPSALSVNNNEVRVVISPGKDVGSPAEVKILPETDQIKIINDTTTGARDTPPAVGVTRVLSENVVRVWGEYPVTGREYSARVSVHEPARWATALFRESLRRHGITVDGETTVRDARSREQFDINGATELASVESQPLGSIIRETNKESNNLYAELLLRTVGKQLGERLAPETSKTRARLRGDDEAGLSVMLRWLNSSGLDARNFALHDGSGLSRLDLVTPQTTAQLFAHMARTNGASVYYDSLPISGKDGTLGGRLQKARERVRAKSGSLSYVSSLAGYVQTADDETFVFSIICNDETDRAPATAMIDRIVELLAAYPKSVAEKNREVRSQKRE